LKVTTHETYTRTRYNCNLELALQSYDFLRTLPFSLLDFNEEDESEARSLIEERADQKYSFHDALCAIVMKRVGIPNIFTFDKHFWTMDLGFTVFPGPTKIRQPL